MLTYTKIIATVELTYIHLLSFVLSSREQNKSILDFRDVKEVGATKKHLPLFLSTTVVKS